MKLLLKEIHAESNQDGSLTFTAPCGMVGHLSEEDPGEFCLYFYGPLRYQRDLKLRGRSEQVGEKARRILYTKLRLEEGGDDIHDLSP